MSIIGLVTENKKFIENILLNNFIQNHVILTINKENIDSIRNVKFETILINTDNKKVFNNVDSLKKILSNTKYLIINSDLKLDLDFIKDSKIIILTYGLNHKATVTLSSMENDQIFLCLQRSVKDILNNKIESQEFNISNLAKEKNLDIYDILGISTILLLYNKLEIITG